MFVLVIFRLLIRIVQVDWNYLLGDSIFELGSAYILFSILCIEALLVVVQTWSRLISGSLEINYLSLNLGNEC